MVVVRTEMPWKCCRLYRTTYCTAADVSEEFRTCFGVFRVPIQHPGDHFLQHSLLLDLVEIHQFFQKSHCFFFNLCLFHRITLIYVLESLPKFTECQVQLLDCYPRIVWGLWVLVQRTCRLALLSHKSLKLLSRFEGILLPSLCHGYCPDSSPYSFAGVCHAYIGVRWTKWAEEEKVILNVPSLTTLRIQILINVKWWQMKVVG